VQEVSLLSADIDCCAACRQAAGVFRPAGHEHLALVIPAVGFGGDAGSIAGLGAGTAGGPAPVMLRHDGAPEDILR
jgi:hypothetical protein